MEAHLRRLYKCAHLCSYFIYYVKLENVLRMLQNYDTSYDGNSLMVGGRRGNSRSAAEDVFLVTGTHEDNGDLWRDIGAAWRAGDHERIAKITSQIFAIPELYREYLLLIKETMAAENVTHLELRAVLGNVKGWTIREEIKVLNDFAEKISKEGLSFGVIVMGGNSKSYFAEIIEARLPVVLSFEFGGDLRKSRELAAKLGAPVFPAETLRGIEQAELSDILGKSPQITGVAAASWTILPVGAIFDYCPAAEAPSSTDILNAAVPVITLSSGRCSAEHDKDLNDNIIQAWKRGLSYFKILNSFVYSIVASRTSPGVAEEMFKRWHEQYAKYYYEESGGWRRYAVDRDCKWFIKTREDLTGLSQFTQKMMERALSRTKQPALEVARGMELYAYKPNISATMTWTTEEYNMPGFQYTYIRLKSLQRYAECYAMYETAFAAASAADLQAIKRVVSIGGGCGFELVALGDYYKQRGCTPPTYCIVDIADSWTAYADLINCDYVVGDVNNLDDRVRTELSRADLFIFSYVYIHLDRFIRDMNGEYRNKRAIFNERRARVNEKIPSERVGKYYVRGVWPRDIESVFQ